MKRFVLPAIVFLACLLFADVCRAGEKVVIITKDRNIIRGEIITETDKFIEVKPEGESLTVKIPKNQILRRMTPEYFDKNRSKIYREIFGIDIPDEKKPPEPLKVGKSHDIGGVKFTWVSVNVAPVELTPYQEMPDMTRTTETSYLIVNYEIENGTEKRLNVKGINQRLAKVGSAKSDKDEDLEQAIFLWPYKGAPAPDPNLAKGGKMIDSIIFIAPAKEAKKATVRLDTDRTMHCGGGHLVLTVPLKEGLIDNSGECTLAFEEKPKKKRSEQISTDVMKDVTFEITDISVRMVHEEKLGMSPFKTTLDIAGERLVISFTVHNKSKKKVRFIPILARERSFDQVVKDSKGESINEYNPPHAYVCGRIRLRRGQTEITLEPGEMVGDLVVLETPSDSAKYIRYLLEISALFPKSKLDAMFNVKIFFRNGEINKRKKPKFTLLKKRKPFNEKQALKLVQSFVKSGEEKFTEKSFGYRVIGQAKVTRIESGELESGQTLTQVFCEVGKTYRGETKTSFMLCLIQVGAPIIAISQGDTVVYKGAIIGGKSISGDEGPEHVVFIALKTVRKK